MWFPNRLDTNQAVHAQKMARDWKFRIKKVEALLYPIAKTKALISFTVTAKLICAFVFAYATCYFSHDQAHLFSDLLDCWPFLISFFSSQAFVLGLSFERALHSDSIL